MGGPKAGPDQVHRYAQVASLSEPQPEVGGLGSNALTALDIPKVTRRNHARTKGNSTIT